MLKPYQIFHQVLFFLLVTFYATVQDTVGWKHSVYVRIPGISSTIINGYGSKIYFGRNLLGYGYQPSNKSEWAISAECFSQNGTVDLFHPTLKVTIKTSIIFQNYQPLFMPSSCNSKRGGFFSDEDNFVLLEALASLQFFCMKRT